MNPSFKTTDAESYDLVAEAFDRLSEIYTAPFAEQLLTLAAIRRGDVVLDLAAGTGVVTRRAAARGARCLAADLSSEMLRVAAASAPDVLPVRMDAENPSLRTASLDVVLCLFGILHFPNPQVVLEQCAAALKPGGTLAFAFGSPPPLSAAIAHAPRVALDCARSRRGRLLKAPAALNGFLLERCAQVGPSKETELASRAGRGKRLVAMTKRAGFTKVSTGWLRHRNWVDSPELFWEIQSVFASTSRKLLSEMTPSRQEELRCEFIELASEVQQQGGALVYDVATTWIHAKAPGYA